jgi:hypothetical protein
MPPQRLSFLVLTLGLGAAVFAGWCARADFARQGDGWEYLAMLEAFDRHGSFDVRPDDITAMFAGIDAAAAARDRAARRQPAREVYGDELPHRFVIAADGRAHADHFWLYPLAAYPARRLLRAAGAPEFNALIVTNVLCAALALGAVLVAGRGTPGRRLSWALLLVTTPVAWYLTFTGVEVFCWALVVAALVGLERDAYGAAAVAAGLAAAQTPPLALVAAVPALVAAWRGHWPGAARAVAGASVTAISAAYYLRHFGEPSLLTRTNTDLGLVSLSRFASLLLDLNVGLLPYVPVLLVALPVAAFRHLVRRDVRALALTLALVGVLFAVQVQVNWNTDGRGLHRYLVWLLPIVSWLVAEAWEGRARTGLVAVSVAVSGAVLVVDPPSAENWLEHRALARRVMQDAPVLYNPPYETFLERSAHGEPPPAWLLQGRRDAWMTALPVAHGRASGEVTKLLVHRASAARLTERYRVAADYLPALLALARGSATPIYVHPPPGTVWAREGRVDGAYAPPPQALFLERPRR